MAIIIILLGLTAIAPEWLDLKDMIIAEHRPDKLDYPLKAPTHIVDQTRDYLINIATLIHQQIVGKNPEFNGWFSNLANGLWSIYATVLYVIFIVFSFLLFLAMNNGFKKIYKPITKLSKGLLYFITLIISFGSALFIWPFMGAIIMGIAKLFTGVLA